MSQLLEKSLKILGAGALLYVAYKLGKNYNKGVELVKPTETLVECDEEKYIIQLIDELKSKKNKTKKDKINLDLLNIKLQQINQSK